MKLYSTNKTIVNRAKRMRKDTTLPESILWSYLKNKQLCGLKFRRQFPVHNYILDFYCHEKRIAIEIDGKTHESDAQIDYDEKRTKILTLLKIRVIRFSNQKLLNNSDAVIEWLKEVVQ